MKGIIYYTDNRLDEPIFSAVQRNSKSRLACCDLLAKTDAIRGKYSSRFGQPWKISQS